MAVIEHGLTGQQYDIEDDLLDWVVADEDDERGMGTETHYMAQIEHPQLGKLTWEIWEYPAGAENMRETHLNGHKLITDFDWGIESEP